MASGIVDLERVCLLLQGLLMDTAAITAVCHIARAHEDPSDGTAKVSLAVCGTSDVVFPSRRGGGTAGNESDECTGALIIELHHRVEEQSALQMRCEGVVSLLRKHATERTINNVSSDIGTGADKIAASGHLVELHGLRADDVLESSDPRDKVKVIRIEFLARRSAGSDSLLAEAA